MAIDHPFRRTCRQFANGSYSEGGGWMYIVDKRFANAPEHYIRAFLMILKDMQTVFDYIEPADTNLPCYSFRIHELLVRTCIEVEANCKAILVENGYTKTGDMNMGDYRKIEASHKLSSYEVRLPLWSGAAGLRKPFLPWAGGAGLPWYQAYNATKHDRHNVFGQATFEQMVDAVCGLMVILSSQFHTQDFSPADPLLILKGYGPRDGMETGIGQYLRVKFPDSWPAQERYEFNWQTIKAEADPFRSFPYPPP